MQTAPKNKAIQSEETTQKAATLERYHFAGGGEYEPTSIEATSYEDALKKWEEIRVPVGKTAPLPLQDNNVVE